MEGATMSDVALTFGELAGVVFAAVALAASDPAALSQIGTTWLATKAGLEPSDIRAFDAATDGDVEQEDES